MIANEISLTDAVFAVNNLETAKKVVFTKKLHTKLLKFCVKLSILLTNWVANHLM